jgi:hypothetical protein
VIEARDLHGMAVAVDADDPRIAHAVGSRLRQLSPARPIVGAGVSFRYVSSLKPGDAPLPGGSCRPVYDPPLGDVMHYYEVDELVIDYGGHVRVSCRPVEGTTLVAYDDALASNTWLLSRPMFTLPLLEMAKRRGRFGLHAGAVSRDGAGILVPGSTGAGKSTLTLALACAGLSFVSDDLVFLTGDESRTIAALGLSEDIDLTLRTVELLPEVAGLIGPAHDGWPKRTLAPAEALGAEVALTCQPQVLVFPRIAGSVRSQLEPLARSDALLELAPNVVLTEPDAAQAHFDALAALVNHCRCYRLHTGTDLVEAARIVAALLV